MPDLDTADPAAALAADLAAFLTDQYGTVPDVPAQLQAAAGLVAGDAPELAVFLHDTARHLRPRPTSPPTDDWREAKAKITRKDPA